MNKFQIYFEPHNNNVFSFTLSISRINEMDDTYKMKIIKEVKTPSKTYTYKIREFHLGIQEIKEKIDKIDFTKKYDKYIDGEMYYIRVDENYILTSNKEQVKYILDLFNFEDLFNINVLQYDKIKNMYEFIKLNSLFVKKVSNIQDSDKFLKLFDYYINKDPYKIFENMNNLENFIF